MRKVWVGGCMAWLFMLLVAAPGQAWQESGPGDVVAELFAAMKAGDAEAMRALMHPDVRLISTSVREGAPVVQVMTVDRWLQGVANSTRELDERIHHTRVESEAGLASVWTGYDLFVDGVHSHCGVDHVLLVMTEQGWRIIELSDTRSTEGCQGA